MSLTAAERETVITVSDADTRVHIWTAQRTAIARMRRHPGFTEVRSGTTEGSVFAEFTIEAALWNPATGAKRRGRTMTDAQRTVNAERLAIARSKVGNPSARLEESGATPAPGVMQPPAPDDPDGTTHAVENS
jgi:hypothetical protein